MPQDPKTQSQNTGFVKKDIKTESQRSKKGDFSEEFEKQEVVVQLQNERLIGRLEEARRYWIKLVTFPEGRTYYINKAWIVYIQPLKMVKK
jgi:hypothetical protein